MFLCQFILREALQAGIVHFFYSRMTFKEFGHLHSVSRMFFHAQSQCLHAAGDEEGIKRAEDGTGHILNAKEADVVDIFLRACDEAGNDVTMAVEVFRSRMDDDVGTEGQGLLDVGRAERVIDDDLDIATGMGNLADAFNIGNLQRRVGRRFQIDDACIRFDSLFHGVQVRNIDEGYVYAIAAQTVVQEGKGAAI